MKNRIIHIVAGLFILISILLAIKVNINWLWFTAFVGANLFQSGIKLFNTFKNSINFIFRCKREV